MAWLIRYGISYSETANYYKLPKKIMSLKASMEKVAS